MSSLTPNTWLLILFALVPGFVANRVFALWCPTQKQDWEKALLEPITWSAINLLFWWWLVLPILQTPFEQLSGWHLLWVNAIVCAVSPTILASVWYWFRTREWTHQKLGLDHPTPRGWEFFLRKTPHFFVLFHLKNGKMVGGYFGPKSYASTYPQEPEIYVQEIWRVDDDGRFLEKVKGSFGSVIRQSEWERIEFFNPHDEEATCVGLHQETEGDTGVASDTAGGPAGQGTTGTDHAGSEHRAEDRSPAGGIGDGNTETKPT